MHLSRHVESYRFWDVVVQWARERMQHEHLVARVLAKGVIREGLRVQSVDPKWASVGSFELRGAPLVGYVSREGDLPIFVRAPALKHLRSVVERAAVPEPEQLHDEFVSKQDFHAWLIRNHILPPSFWYEVPEKLRADTSVEQRLSPVSQRAHTP
ncbi:hypothetical protein [Ramlibacter sp. WS9]|uniref:hypothetical protein n=1 Tax=Ramlibacter sp. WS9 TaxID=1882741 RepID=UPI0011413630|nr:hypothetical protein [Ramlibacter sp. WS9]ROZ64122.1 hypothetical protein EEB15_29110 [Ramlibacter sp. WS9]